MCSTSTGSIDDAEELSKDRLYGELDSEYRLMVRFDGMPWTCRYAIFGEAGM
jgi:hypothetical protein